MAPAAQGGTHPSRRAEKLETLQPLLGSQADAGAENERDRMRIYDEEDRRLLDEDRRYDAWIEMHEARRQRQCQCHFEMPGQCPGPSNCPMAQEDE